ncbi:hypothetical protein EJ02DRAFT_475857 [Clathrospora elynae]|uniref:Uncharacterized protein n=1 Tax=Clathrospora elynae TaxID=706981 RepID=A0A6A5T9E7_9PLEO|nr:hypothetical protein EJ02DRAFT_475857 [Clathrospora elynae]
MRRCSRPRQRNSAEVIDIRLKRARNFDKANTRLLGQENSSIYKLHIYQLYETTTNSSAAASRLWPPRGLFIFPKKHRISIELDPSQIMENNDRFISHIWGGKLENVTFDIHEAAGRGNITDVEVQSRLRTKLHLKRDQFGINSREQLQGTLLSTPNAPGISPTTTRKINVRDSITYNTAHQHRSKMSTTTMSFQPIASLTPPNSFFDHLNYDVRHIIYENFDDLPPLTSGESFSGFVMSSQQAKLEVEEFASKKAAKQLHNFQELLRARVGVHVEMPDIPKDSSFVHLCSIGLTLPFGTLFMKKAVHGWPSQVIGYGWKTGVLQSLHTLLASNYNTVHLHFTGTPEPKNDSSPAAITTRMFQAVADIGSMIQYANMSESERLEMTDYIQGLTSDERKAELDEAGRMIDTYGDLGTYLNPYYAAENPRCPAINTRSVTISWDLRTAALNGSPTPLQGMAYKAKFNGFKYMSAHAPRLPVYHHIHNPGRTVVEMGFSSPKRWQPTADEAMLIFAMPEEVDELYVGCEMTSPVEHCYVASCASSGVGTEPEMGDFA